jgi:hypothetical protein
VVMLVTSVGSVSDSDRRDVLSTPFTSHIRVRGVLCGCGLCMVLES